MDNVWHTLILHTRQYIEFCYRYFGRYIHHEPADPGDEPISEEYKRLYKEQFGQPLVRDAKALWCFTCKSCSTSCGITEVMDNLTPEDLKHLFFGV